MLKEGERVLLGVSGGPDSLAMLYLFNELRKTRGLRIYVAHLNHLLRKEAQADLDFVRDICLSLDIPFVSGKANIRKSGGSLEESARQARMDFLIRTARKIKAKTISLGHTKDDQAETILMRLLRGSGLLGLVGIVPKRQIQGITFIRPLIETERKDIEDYLKKIKVKPRRDKTNQELEFFRNRIRHKLIPLLARGYNRNIKELLANAAQIFASDYDYIRQETMKSLRYCAVFIHTSKSTLAKIKLERFKRLHPAMQRMVLRLAIEKIKGNTRRLTFQHWKEVHDLIYSRKPGSIVDLPSMVSAKKESSHLILSIRKP